MHLWAQIAKFSLCQNQRYTSTKYFAHCEAVENFSSLTWSCVNSQPLVRIRLKTYLPGNKLPGKNVKGLGSSSFARHYSRNHYLFSIPRPTKMFQFSRFPPNSLCIQEQVTRHDSSWVSPFGYSRIKACWQLPETFRSLPRPSSVIYVKASIVCSWVPFYAST